MTNLMQVSTLRYAIATMATVATLLFGIHSFANAHAGGPHGWIYVGGDKVLNYDHRSKSSSANNIDWPLHLIFRNNATVNKVKGTDGSHSLDNNVFKALGGAKYLQLSEDGTNFEWDSDKGRKKFNCKPLVDYNKWTEHYRVYADSDDRMWTPQHGYYVLATAHFDYDDPESPGPWCNDAKFGWDEMAADNILYYYTTHSSGPRWSTWESDAYFGNNEQSHDDYINGNLHHRTSDGYYHSVTVP